MTATTSSRPRGGEPRADTGYRRQGFRGLIAGVAVGLGCATVAAAAVGTGMYVSTNFDPKDDARPVLTGTIAAYDSAVSPVISRFPGADAELAPMTHVSLTDPAMSPRTADTKPASAPPKLSSLALASPKAAAEIIPLPPRAPRAQLASLTPPDQLKITPQDDAVPDRTAIYDITAQAVYMPNGEKLEAHSGFGAWMDNPRHVNLKMRGATPPNTYKLTMRERRFHGHEAIRMTPEDPASMYNRAGILVHPYLLGPNGQSNGCVSVKDYPKFLAAFKRGEVDRIVVVAKLDQPPAAYARANPNNIGAWLAKISDKMF